MLNCLLTCAAAILVTNAAPIENRGQRAVEPQGTFETAEEYKGRLEFEVMQARLIPTGRPLGRAPMVAEKR